MKRTRGAMGRKRLSNSQRPTVDFDGDGDHDEEIDSEEEEEAEYRNSQRAKRSRGRGRGGGEDDDEETSSDDSEDEDGFEGSGDGEEGGSSGEDSDDDEGANETAEERRLRMAKEFLSTVDRIDDSDDDHDGIVEGSEDEDEDGGEAHDRVGEMLREKRMEARGELRREVADEISDLTNVRTVTRWLKGHHLPVTSVATSPDDTFAVTGSKDNAVIQHDLETGQRMCTLIKSWSKKRKSSKEGCERKACQGEVLCVTVSPDGRTVATGGRDRVVRLFDLRADPARASALTGDVGTFAFRGHKDAVTGLAFDLGSSNTLYSASMDRTIKSWNAKDRGYIDTMFGHQSDISDIDSVRRYLVTVGRDRTVRLWKPADEKQLVFRGSTSCTSIDCVRMLTQDCFVSGDDDGMISMWSSHKKKAVCSVLGVCRDTPFITRQVQEVLRTDRRKPWMCSLGIMRNTDLVASGSSDGFVRLWRADLEPRGLTQVGAVGIKGFVNGMAFSRDGKLLLCAVGQEHRMGRWERIAGGAQNALGIVKLRGEDN